MKKDTAQTKGEQAMAQTTKQQVGRYIVSLLILEAAMALVQAVLAVGLAWLLQPGDDE